MSSGDQETHVQLRQVRRDIHEFIKLMDGLLDSVVEEMTDAVRFQSGAFEVTVDPVFLRVYVEVDRQLAALPGNPPTVPLVPMTHAGI